ncbi:MAG TPA: substrate-binding domain-containing protein [Pseudolysinimonas sp.]|nr:substrate-binding domain-containing protein [Pseudolysinimonas sp.]
MKVRHSSFLIGVTAALLALTACSAPAPQPSSSSAGGDNAALVAEAQANVKVLYGSTSVAPKKKVERVKGASLWIVSCGEVAVGCAVPAAGAKAAAQELGWKATVCDGKFGAANGYNDCISQGVTAGASAIVTIGVDCEVATASLSAAEKAGIPTATTGGANCDSGGVAYDSLAIDPTSFYTKVARAAADTVIAETKGDAHVITVSVTGIHIYDLMIKVFKERMSECKGCTVTEVGGGLGDLGNGNLKTAVSTAITANPDANAMFVTVDGNVGLLEIPQALQAADRNDSVYVVAGQGTRLDLIRAGRGLDAVIGWDATWQGWALTDTALRLLAGEEISVNDTSSGIALVDKTHNLPKDAKSTLFADPVNYVAAFTKIWAK